MRFLIFALVSILLLPEQATAQRYWAPNQVPDCPQAVSGEECRAASLGLLLDKLELPTAEQVARDGYQAIRLFRYDAFGMIWPAASIVARPMSQHRREGAVQAVTIHADGEVSSLERPVWEGAWLEMDRLIDGILARPPEEYAPPPPTGPNQPPPMACLDPPRLIIEVIYEGEVRRWWPDTCQADDATALAQRVPELIAAAFPACGHFDIAHYGRGVGRLRVCLQVSGDDPFAAAQVMQILTPGVGGDTRIAYEAEWHSEDATLVSIDGRDFMGRDAVVQAMRNGALGNRWLRILSATGNHTGVQVDGQLVRVGTPNQPDPVAVQIHWVRNGQGEWRITRWTVDQGRAG
jgi:hypothetical protein